MKWAKTASTILSSCAWAATAQGNFQISAVKTDEGTRDVVEVYYYNDGVGGTGSRLAAYQANYGGVPIQFLWSPPGNGDPGEVDIFNRTNNPDFSWFRVHPLRQSIFYADPATTSQAWASPIDHFQVVYTTAGLSALAANNGHGVRFGRLVIPDGATFSLNTRVGGEIGLAVNADFDYFIANVPPVFTGDGTIVSAIGAAESRVTHRVSASDPDGQLHSFTLTDVNHAASAGFDLVPVGADAFDVSWDPAVVTHGDYAFDLLARDSSVQSNSISASRLVIRVVPEPMSVALVLAGAALRRIRRR